MVFNQLKQVFVNFFLLLASNINNELFSHYVLHVQQKEYIAVLNLNDVKKLAKVCFLFFVMFG